MAFGHDGMTLPFTAQESHQGRCEYPAQAALRGLCALVDRLILLFVNMFERCVGIKAVLTSKLTLALDVHFEGRHWGALLWLAPRTSHGRNSCWLLCTSADLEEN